MDILLTVRVLGCLIPIAIIGERPTLAQLAGTSDGIGTNFLRWHTNGPAICRIYQFTMTSTFTNVGGKIIHRPVSRNFTDSTNFVFDHFIPESLHFQVWTNLIGRTNGRTTRIWSVRTHPDGWPKTPPIVTRDTNGLMWGMKGLTALSPCWEIEGAPGQVPVTALTRRHGYTRGHSLGPPGFSDAFRGRKVWFVTTNNAMIQATVIESVNGSHIGQDYTILLFKEDLPPTIQPMRVLYQTNLVSKYPFSGIFRSTFFKSEQSGQVSADIPGFTVNTWKGGDSGSPNMLPFFNELVFIGGRSTSPPSPEMQADMDELCRRHRLEPKRYQMQSVDLSSFPSYKM